MGKAKLGYTREFWLLYGIDHHEVYFSRGKGVKPLGKKGTSF